MISSLILILIFGVIVLITAPLRLLDDVTLTSSITDAIATAGGGRSLREVILLGVNFILGFVGIIAVIMLIYGGFQYMTSRGEDTEKPRNTIIYAIVGIIIILFSFAIVNTVFDVTTGSDVGSGGI